MDDNHSLSSSACPPSPQDNSDMQEIAVNATPQDLEVTSDTYISIPGTLHKVHIVTLMGFDYGYESRAELSDSDCVFRTGQHVKPKVNATKTSQAKRRCTGFKKTSSSSMSSLMYTGKKMFCLIISFCKNRMCLMLLNYVIQLIHIAIPV